MFSFLSIEFALSFLGFLLLYWACRPWVQLQNTLLLLASWGVLVLMASINAVAVLLAFALCIYVLTWLMQRYATRAKLWLSIGVVMAVVQLLFFKYFDFFRPEIVSALSNLQLDTSQLLSNIIMPLGLSYYTFQGISYLHSRYQLQQVDAHTAPLTLLQLLLHLSFMGTISAGPIARTEHARGMLDIHGHSCGMREQLKRRQPRHLLYPSLALCLIVLALIKKWWLATYLADVWVDPVFDNPMQYQSLEVLVAIYGYTLQLFFDFSGYSDLMIALGLLLGLRLPQNFRAPLLAHNIRVFWERWHISLSTWIRDYIYIPLGGSRDDFMRTQVNLLLAMVLSGIWHGSGWNFFLWGLLHGCALVMLNILDFFYADLAGVPQHQARNALSRSHWLGKIIAVIITINLVCFLFVFFRAKTLADAQTVFAALLSNGVNVPWQNNPLYALSLMLVAWVMYALWQPYHTQALQRVERVPYVLMLPLLLLLFAVIMLMAPSGIPGFIYANF